MSLIFTAGITILLLSYFLCTSLYHAIFPESNKLSGLSEFLETRKLLVKCGTYYGGNVYTLFGVFEGAIYEVWAYTFIVFNVLGLVCIATPVLFGIIMFLISCGIYCIWCVAEHKAKNFSDVWKVLTSK